AFLDLDERAKVCEANRAPFDHIAKLMGIEEAIPSVWFEILDRQTQSAAVDVDVGYHRVDLLAFLEHVRRMFDSFGPGNIRDVNQTVDAVLSFDERSEVG